MKIKEIIESLCNHEISKQEAIDQIKSITDGLRKNGSFEFKVAEIGYYATNSDKGYLKLESLFPYSKMANKVNQGDIVDVVFIP